MTDAYQRHRDEIAAMLDQRRWPIEWVDQQIAEGAFDLFWNDEALIAVEVRTYPGGLQEYHGVFAAGALKSIKSLVGEAVEMARHAGLTLAAIESRHGWAREFKDMGFTVAQVRIEKELA